VTASSRLRPWLPALLLLPGLLVLHQAVFGAAFLNDDYLFLEHVQRHGLWQALREPGGLGNYFRPVSRELWFALLAPLSGGEPLAFHLSQFVLWCVGLALLADLLRALLPTRAGTIPVAVLAGVLWYALLPFQRVNLLWASCSQDLLALAGTLGAFALFRRGRLVPAWIVFAAATLSKQSALPLPLLLFAWSRGVDGEPVRRALARSLPFVAAALPWLAGEWLLRQHSPAAARLVFDGSHLAAAGAHLLQALAGIEHASGWLRSWADARPSILAFAALALVARWLPARATAGAPAPPAVPRPPARVVVRFALAWCAAFALPVWPVAHSWSGYHYTLAAVGGAILVGLATARLARWGWIVLAGALLWWHAAGISAPAFALREDPWTGTSHVTSFYLERAASLSRDLRAALRRVLPRPERDTRLFFAALPSWAGFQMGNGPSVRQLYRDPTLESHFYSAYGESTAARLPAEFLFWNGIEFERLYAGARDRLFQVGGDLLLLERPTGAAWAFRRGLEQGGERADHWYWLGWASLWSGERGLAERAWREWGARDDSAARILWLRKAKGSLERGDTLRARRELVEAVRSGIGSPEAHAMLGLLLQRVNAKYAMLETRVAAELNPRDWLARRDLVEGLVAARLDEPAARHLAAFQALVPGWRSDTVAVRLEARLRARRPETGGVVRFHPGGRR
jgi:hypothetical protein